MPVFVPSQIREFIDLRFEVAKTGQSFKLFPEHAPILEQLLFMIDSMPEHLMILRGMEAAEYGEALRAVRHVVRLWGQSDRGVALEALPGQNSLNPLTKLRRYFDKFGDEALMEPSTALLFVKDEDLRRSLSIDLRAINDALDRASWKPATVLAGAVTEALLLDALVRRENEAKAAKVRLGQGGSSELSKWDLHLLTEVASELGIIDKPTTEQCRIAKDFRNLIHPGAAMRKSIECDRGTAFAAVAAVEAVLRTLRKAT